MIIDGTAFAILMLCGSLFLVCVLLRVRTLSQMIRLIGGTTSWSSPALQRLREERLSLHQVDKEHPLRKKLKLINAAAILSWLVGLSILVTHGRNHY